LTRYIFGVYASVLFTGVLIIVYFSRAKLGGFFFMYMQGLPVATIRFFLDFLKISFKVQIRNKNSQTSQKKGEEEEETDMPFIRMERIPSPYR